MKALVIYTTKKFAERAGATLHRVEGRTEIKIEWTMLAWSMDELNKRKFAQEALVQAQDVHLIVLPAKLRRSISLHLLRWLERWAKLRHNPDAALGILDDSGLGHVEAPVHPALLKFVRKHGLTLISNENRYSNDLGKLADFFMRERKLSWPVEWDPYGNHDQPRSHRSFGINE